MPPGHEAGPPAEEGTSQGFRATPPQARPSTAVCSCEAAAGSSGRQSGTSTRPGRTRSRPQNSSRTSLTVRNWIWPMGWFRWPSVNCTSSGSLAGPRSDERVRRDRRRAACVAEGARLGARRGGCCRRREALSTRSDGKGQRREVERILRSVRSFYTDLHSWAVEEPEKWAAWVAPCPVPDNAFRRLTAAKRRIKERIDDRIRRRPPPGTPGRRLPARHQDRMARVRGALRPA
jgi:hypothetical protein